MIRYLLLMMAGKVLLLKGLSGCSAILGIRKFLFLTGAFAPGGIMAIQLTRIKRNMCQQNIISI